MYHTGFNGLCELRVKMQYGKVDLNQAQIVRALRKAGASVLVLSSVGQGCPDICVSYKGQTWYFEIKSPGGRLTQAEEVFAQTWQGNYQVIYSVEEALKVLSIAYELN